MAEGETVVSDHDGCKLIPIITTENGRLTFQEGSLTALLDREILKDTPIAVVSIAGKKRLGKSLFLNLILRYFKKQGWASDTQDWLSGWNSSTHDGFVAKGGDDPVTTGIIAWRDPIFVHCPAQNKKIAIILLDTEGSFDTKNRNTSVGIFALSTLFSSLQIFNLDKQITLDDLDYLKYFTKQARVLAQHQRTTDVDRGKSDFGIQSRRFQNLVFLVRNWSNLDRPYGSNDGQQYMQRELANFIENDGHIDVECRHPIYGAFQALSCFLMPEPGKHVRIRGKEGPTLNVEDLGEDFTSLLNSFVREYLHPDSLPTKLMKAGHLLTFLKQCATRIESGYLPELKDIDELMANEVILKATRFATDSYVSTIEKLIEDAEKPDWITFNEALKNQKQLVTENFRNEVKLYVSPDGLDEEATKMQQTLDDKTGNDLIKKMQKKIVPYAKKLIVDLFVRVVKKDIHEMEDLLWENFEERVKIQMIRMDEKFLEDVLHPDTNINLENERSDLNNQLKRQTGDSLTLFMRKMRKEFVKNKSQKCLDETKELLQEYSSSTFFPLMSRNKEIKHQRVADFERRVKVDDRDSKSVKEAVEKFKTHAKEAETSADAKIGLRYAGSAVLATGAAAGTFIALPFAIPLCLAAAGGCAVGSFSGTMLCTKAIAFISKMFSKEKTS